MTAGRVDAGEVAAVGSVSQLFLAGGRAVADALGDPAVASAWDRPSVLEDQLVSGLAGHLARGRMGGR